MISLFSTFFRSFFVHFVEFIVRLWFSNRLSLRFQRYRAIPHVHLLIFKPNSLSGCSPSRKETRNAATSPSSSLIIPFIFLQLFASLFVEREFRLFNFVVFSGRIRVFSSRKRHSFPFLRSFIVGWIFRKARHTTLFSRCFSSFHTMVGLSPKQKFCIRRGAARLDI